MSGSETMQDLPSSLPKKRKASELRDEPHMNGNSRKSKSSSKKSRSKSKSKNSDPEFRVTCPAAPSKAGQKDAFRSVAEIWKDFKFEYTVRPASWGDIRSYKNVKLSDNTFSIGHIIFVNSKTDPPPEPADLDDDQMLQYDRENFWVAKLLDARANSEKVVYLLVAWFYWTDELPMGKQPYHGDAELVLSNHLDIIDATTISSMADWTFWNEWDDDLIPQRPERFWRQTLDLGKNRLSEIRRHCVCNQPQHPDEEMVMCESEKCSTWNHERCMIEDISKRAWESYQEGSIETFVKDRDLREVKSFGARVLDPVRAVGKFLENGMESMIEATEDAFHEVKPDLVDPTSSSKSSPKRNRPKKDAKNQSLMDKTIKVTLETDGDSEPMTYKIQELVGEQRVWNIGVTCLQCGSTMR